MSARRIIVVGAGVIGVTTAHALLADGHEVTLLEAAADAACGASHANGGFLSAAFCAPWAAPGLPRQTLAAMFNREAPFRWRPDGSLAQLRWMRELLSFCNAPAFSHNRRAMVQLALLSRACLAQTVAQTGARFDHSTTGVLHLFRDAIPPASTITARLEELTRYGIDAAWCTPEQVRALEPALSRTAPVAGALHVRDDMSGDCAHFVRGVLDWSRGHGLRVEVGTAVTSLELSRDGRRLSAVHTAAQRWEADAFVFATGVDTERLLRPFVHLPVLPVKGYSVTADVAADAGPRCAVIDDSTKLAVARLDSRIRLAGMAEIVGYDRRVDVRRCELLVRQYVALYGPLPTTERSLWAGLRPATPQGTPLIGATPIAGLFVNTGQGAYGWTLASGSARLLADLVAGRDTALDPASYAVAPRLN